MFLRRAVLFSLALLSFAVSEAQTGTITGRVRDPETLVNLRGATVGLRSIRDSSFFVTTNTDSLGRFRFEGIQPDSFRVRYSYVGYVQLEQTFRLDSGASRDLDDILLPRASKELEGVVIQGTTPPAVQKNDTVQFNASAYKVNPDATSEDLVRKLPGITIENGVVKSNGENVQKVTIDGRELFGDDATAALRNLPAEVIDKIQVFDRLSDQAQLTGFDDGSSQRGINIVTKANMRNGQFGRIYAGAGTDDNASELRYQAGGNTTILKENRRISLVGNFNNINQQNFAQQDLLGVTSTSSNNRGGGRQGGGGNRQGGRPQGGGNGGFGSSSNFLVGQQTGINRTTALGVNFSDLWGKKKNLTITGSYFFNNNRNTTYEESVTDYFASSKNAFNRTTDTTTSSANNTNHRINARLEWKIDSFNQLIFAPNLSFQINETDRLTNRFFGYTTNTSGLTERVTANTSNSRRNANNINGSLLFRHSFAKRGRTFSVNINRTSNTRTGETFVTTRDRQFFGSTLGNDSASQRFTDQDNDGWQLNTNLIYTEPVGTKGQLQLNYNPVVSRSNANQMTYAFDSSQGKYSRFLDSLSNRFNNKTDAQNGGLSYRFGDRDRMLSFGVNYQHTRLRSDQTFPRALNVDNSFDNILPNAMLRWKLSTRSSVRFNYRAGVNTPSVTQLQGVVDFTNAPIYTVGNPDLDPQYTHTLSGQYTFTNTAKGQLLVLNVFGQAADNYISTATFQPRLADSLVAGYTIPRLSQLNKPVNLDGYRSLRGLVNYAFPIKAIKTNLNLNTGVQWNRLPGIVNNEVTQTDNTVFSLGTVFASNISQYVDFTISYTGNFNDVNSRLKSKDSSSSFNYFQHVASVQLNLLSKNGWLLQTDATNQYYTGYSNLPAQVYTLWNLAIGKKLGKDRKSDIRLSVFDLLGQNQSIIRDVQANYIETQTTQVLQRYYMLTFTYNLRNFGTAAARAANRAARGAQ
ncbi:MAG: TonB-dependent receptor [Chitinophagaceae bacterium]|nr:MAG: TonB-dependent receptor [Chitinophagaceae bacterium]